MAFTRLAITAVTAISLATFSPASFQQASLWGFVKCIWADGGLTYCYAHPGD